MQEFEEDYYAILGVEQTASLDEIRKAYLALAKKLHPDRFPNDPEQRVAAQREFAKVTRAHNVISDAESRAEYDALRVLAQKRASQSSENLAASGTKDENGMDKSDPAIASDQSKGRSETDNINVKWANKHLERADDLYRRKRYQEAETAMKEAIRLVPTEPKYHNKLAEIYFARGWRTLAMTEVQASLRIDPKDVEARTLEVKIKAATREQTLTGSLPAKGKKGLFEQIKEILTKKL